MILNGDFVSKERNLFDGVSLERMEKALSILYSSEEVKVKVKLKPKDEHNEKAQGPACTLRKECK